MAIITVRPLDAIMARYGEDLRKLGDPSKVRRVIARAANYEGRKAHTRVKRALRKQTSIPAAVVQRSTRFFPSKTSGMSAVEAVILGTGKPLSLKVFGVRQNARGVRARIWGKSKQLDHGFMGPRPGAIAAKLQGHAYVRAGKARMPIQRMFGPGIANELVKDESAGAFRASQPMIIARVAKEIAAVMRGY